MGPITIFDKSALQSLSPDEAVWFDAFFLGNITPLFYVETLADLEKAVREGQTPERVVGALARKTPYHAVPNVHHRTLYLSELAGSPPVTMDGRPIISGGIPKRNPDGTLSVHFDEFPEAAALNRWQNHQFQDIERAVAKDWRVQLSQQDHDTKIGTLRNIFPAGTRISNVEDLKRLLDDFCNGCYPELIELVLDILDVPMPGRPKILEQWKQAGRPPLVEFAPYTTHIFKVDAVFYLGIDRGFIAGERQSNMADMAYLYYLPFSMVFTSGDRLHARTVPLFLRTDQEYLPADDLKSALHELDQHFDALPDEVKKLGVMQFAGYPPHRLDNAVTRMWDKTMSRDWRKISEEQEAKRGSPRDKVADKALIERLNEMRQSGHELADGESPQDLNDADQMFIKRTMPVFRGKWRMVSEEVEQAEHSKQDDGSDD